MKEIIIQSFAKINLSLDVVGTLENGMHQVDMVMQQLSFHDDVRIAYTADPACQPGEFHIQVSTNRYYIPTDERNLAYKAAALMGEEYGRKVPGGKIEIEIFKRIPVAAGLAGGSGNGAAVLHGLNILWRTHLPLSRLCEAGAKLGSDVPFCVMGQARGNLCLPKKLRKNAMAAFCARATGTGTDLIPLPGIRRAVIIAKPPMGVSTGEVYGGIDDCVIPERPDNDRLAEGLRCRNHRLIYRNCINVLENYTLAAYPQVRALKDTLSACGVAEKVLMSGSGPTVFATFRSISDAKKICADLRKQGYEAYWTKTMK